MHMHASTFAHVEKTAKDYASIQDFAHFIKRQNRSASVQIVLDNTASRWLFYSYDTGTDGYGRAGLRVSPPIKTLKSHVGCAR